MPARASEREPQEIDDCLRREDSPVNGTSAPVFRSMSDS
jgi:hypothetical protein